MAIEVTKDHVEDIKYVEQLVERTVMPLHQRIEAALVAAALMRCAWRLMQLYPESVRAQLKEGAAAFLNQATIGDAEQETGRPLLLPAHFGKLQ